MNNANELMLEHINRSLNAITSSLDSEKPRVPKSFFMNKLLPWLLTDTKEDKRFDYWFMSLAKFMPNLNNQYSIHPQNLLNMEAYLIDDVSGETIAIIPPLMAPIILQGQIESKPIESYFRKANELAGVRDFNGRDQILNQLSASLVSKVDAGNLDRWKELFDSLGINGNQQNASTKESTWLSDYEDC